MYILILFWCLPFLPRSKTWDLIMWGWTLTLDHVEHLCFQWSQCWTQCWTQRYSVRVTAGVICGKFLCTVLQHVVITSGHEISGEKKKRKFSYWSWSAWPVFCPGSSEDVFLYFSIEIVPEGDISHYFVKFLCGQYILNSNISEKIALLT